MFVHVWWGFVCCSQANSIICVCPHSHLYLIMMMMIVMIVMMMIEEEGGGGEDVWILRFSIDKERRESSGCS